VLSLQLRQHGRGEVGRADDSDLEHGVSLAATEAGQ
jgi:hypothetical protein